MHQIHIKITILNKLKSLIEFGKEIINTWNTKLFLTSLIWIIKKNIYSRNYI